MGGLEKGRNAEAGTRGKQEVEIWGCQGCEGLSELERSENR